MYPVLKIFMLLSTLYIVFEVTGKISMHFSQFFRSNSIMPNALDIVLCSKSCRHNPTDHTGLQPL